MSVTFTEGTLSRVIEWPLDGGEVVLVEVADDNTGLERVGRDTAAGYAAGETLQSALRRVQPAVTALVENVRDAAGAADRVTVRFGVKLTVAAGAVIAKTSGEANFEISVEWTGPTSTPRG